MVEERGKRNDKILLSLFSLSSFRLSEAPPPRPTPRAQDSRRSPPQEPAAAGEDEEE